MAYTWKPTKAQRREFAKKMQNDVNFRNSYYERQEKRAEKKRATSRFDYYTAGGEYIPTAEQYEAAYQLQSEKPTKEQSDACDFVIYGYLNNKKIHHDYIHIINEYRRKL